MTPQKTETLKWKMLFETGSIKETAQSGRPSRGTEPCAGANHQIVAH
jgi:hypothetical protein